MRWGLRLLTLGLLVLGSPGLAGGPKAGLKGIVPETCGDYGTSVHFEKSPKEAAAKALKDEKLVLVIHISGYFEEPDYT